MIINLLVEMICLRKSYVWLIKSSSYVTKFNEQLFFTNTCSHLSNPIKSTRSLNNHKNVIKHSVYDSYRFKLGFSNFLVGLNKFGSKIDAHYQAPVTLRSIYCGVTVNPFLLSRSLQPLTSVNLYSTNTNTESTGDSKNIVDNEKKSLLSPFIPSRFLSSTPPIDKKEKPCEEYEKLNLFQKFRQMYRDYWYVLIPVHCLTSICWFSGFYVAATSGVDLVAILEYLNVSDAIMEPLKRALNGRAKAAGVLAVAFAMYKIVTPVRYAVTLGGTTFAINYLKKCGYIKPIPKKDELKHMYQVRKDQIKEKQQQIKKNVIEHFKDTEANKKPR